MPYNACHCDEPRRGEVAISEVEDGVIHTNVVVHGESRWLL